MVEVKLNMLMMGKTGNGKSTTANMILNKKVNKTSSNATSETKDVHYSFAQFDNYLLLVVDGPGLEDTHHAADKDKEVAARNMDKALAMCYGGVDAFLFVFKFANRMTTEERSALDALKGIFGDSFMKHVIVVLTYGDQFHFAMKEEGRNISFHDWCKEQTGEFRQLFEDCDGRVVLVNNREADSVRKHEQVKQIVQLTHNLQTKSGRYTSECFKLAEQERKKLILNHKAPHLKREFQEKICTLCAEIDNLSATSSNIGKDRVRGRILDLKYEIKLEDEGCDVLRELISLMDDMERSLNDVEELMHLNGKLESIRRARKAWTALGVVCAVVSGDIGFTLRYVIGDRLSDLHTKEVITEQKMNEIEKERITLSTNQVDRKRGQKEEKCQLL